MMAPPMTSAPRVLRYLDNEELTTGAGTLLVSALAEMQRRQEYVNLCLSGGPTVLSALTHFAALARTGAFDASRLQLWWASERFVTTTDPVRNSVQALSILAGAVTLVPSQIHAMPSRTGKTDPDDAAYAYAKDIGDTQFDITMLELGDDGHIASIFPNHPSYAVQSTTTLQAVGVADAPMDPRAGDPDPAGHQSFAPGVDARLRSDQAGRAGRIAARRVPLPCQPGPRGRLDTVVRRSGRRRGAPLLSLRSVNPPR